jgi:hypothetical protein
LISMMLVVLLMKKGISILRHLATFYSIIERNDGFFNQ